MSPDTHTPPYLQTLASTPMLLDTPVDNKHWPPNPEDSQSENGRTLWKTLFRGDSFTAFLNSPETWTDLGRFDF